jgi:plastocyanin
MLLVASVTAPAQEPHVVQVQLSSFKFEPAEIHLRAGEPVVLRLTNTSNGGHNFAAPQFFGAATIQDGGGLEDGAIEVPSGQTREIRLAPARGTYRLRCTHTLHTTFGMSGSIVVE